MRASARPADETRLLQLVFYGYVLGSLVARWIPERLAYWLADVLGGWSAKRSKKRATVARNLSRITGEAPSSPVVQHLVISAFRSYARYWLETFRLVREDKAFFLDRFRSAGFEHLDERLARGEGALVVVGHLGNYDAAGAWMAARGQGIVTVAEVLRPRRMYEFFREHRTRLGIEILPAEKGVSSRLVEALGQGRAVAIVGDRDLRQTGPEVDFFGYPARFPAGPAAIALRARVPVLVAGVFGISLEDGRRGWLAEIAEPIELATETDTTQAIAQLTQEIAYRLEDFVARRPEEWHVFQPFWKEDLQQR